MTAARGRPGPVAAVVLRRRFANPRAVVYAAWTDPEHLQHWLRPSAEWSLQVVEFDLRPGGRYRFGFCNDGRGDGPVFVVGRFLSVEPALRLVFTWTWEAPDPHAGRESRVTVEFAGAGDGTEVTVTHALFPDGATRRRHLEGWQGALESLFDHLGAG